MTGRRELVHTAVLFVLPIAVAGMGISIWSAVILVLVMLLSRWLIVLSGFAFPVSEPAIVLESISASHFVEKVRWNMDVAGIAYEERAAAGTLGAFFLGRTVPRLSLATGAVRSKIGNSREILRYLWGAFAEQPGVTAAHLEPTMERLELEQRFDRYGRQLQVWAYYHLLNDRDATLHVWGARDPAVPAWQRWLLRPLFPLLSLLIRNSFSISTSHYERAANHIRELLEEMDATLADGRASILGGDDYNFTDFQFAAMTGLWLQPEGYGGHRGRNVRLESDRMPAPMRGDVDAWRERYPRVANWVEKTYAEAR